MRVSANFVEHLLERGEEASRVAFRFWSGEAEEPEALTHGELLRWARGIGARLQALDGRGQRVLLLFDTGPELIAAFLGCLFAGAIAVPSYPPRGTRGRERLLTMIDDCRPRLVLSEEQLLLSVDRVLEEGGIGENVRVLLCDPEWASSADDWRDPALSGRDLAFLQYTSGSTSSPKGVEVSHGNLLHNEALIQSAFGMRPESRVFGWLPLYHDMGLIGNVLQPLYTGCEAILMSPVDFVRKPERWLRGIERFGADVSGGPNFAYELCTRRIEPAARRDLDLSGWRVAFNGAEPIRASTLERFASTFAGCGFDARAFLPCYGLAEATLLVSGRSLDRTPRTVETVGSAATAGEEVVRRLVSCGPPAGDLEIAIVDPETLEPLAEGEVGEIWLRGESVTQGYWGNPPASEEAFGARTASGSGPYLRTGDLGFLSAGELLVEGRLKELIIIRGRNYYPQDLELTAERAHPDLRSGCSAAFSVSVEGEERLVLVAELERHSSAAGSEIAEAVRREVAEEHLIQLHELVPIRAHSLPKTTSGKIQRRLCRQLYLAGGLRVETPRVAAQPASTETAAAPPAELDPRLAELGALCAECLDLAPATLEVDTSLTAQGLDSIRAMLLVQRVEERLGLELDLAAVLEGASPRQLLAGAEASAARPGASLEPSPPRLPATHGQRALWFLQQLEPQSAAYLLAFAARVEPPPDPRPMRRALELLSERHEALRTRFVEVDGEPEREISPRAEIDFEVFAGEWDEPELRRLIEREAYRPMRLDRAPLLRLRLFERAGETALVWSIHHAISDFWSLAILGHELAALYGDLVAGGDPPPSGRGSPLVAVVQRDRRRLSGPSRRRLEAYADARIADGLPRLDLPTDRPRGHGGERPGGLVTARLGAEESAALEAWARRSGSTFFGVLLSGYFAFLHRLTGQSDLVVGTPVADREEIAVAGVVDYLVAPVPVRVEVGVEKSATELLADVSAALGEAIAHRGLPTVLLAERLGDSTRAGSDALFQTLLSYQTPPPGAPAALSAFALGREGVRIELGAMSLRTLALAPRSSRFELSVALAADPEGRDGALAAACEFDRDLFDRSTAERRLRGLLHLLSELARHPHRALRELSLLTAAERHQLLVEWSAGPTPSPSAGADVVGAIARAAAEHGERQAVVFDSGEGAVTMSYAATWDLAGRVARELSALGCSPGDRVGVLLEPALELPAALLGIWRLGAAYVPLDPQLPEARLRYVIADAELGAVLFHAATAGLLDRLSVAAEAPAIARLDLSAAAARPAAGDPRPPAELAGHAAYVIYTSGTTGLPKGVVVPHHALWAFLVAMRERPGSTAADRVLAQTTISFDISVLELFLPLVSGGATVLVPRALASDGDRLAAVIERSRVSLAQATPSTWKLLISLGWNGAPGLRVLCGGESLDRALADRLVETASEAWNVYGPTETTVWSSCERLGEGERIAIGRPIAGTELYALDRDRRPVPAGVPGELWIGGAGVANGYRGRAALTAERFRPDPFSGRRGARLYRSGDVVRQDATGRFEHLGRVDHQVKVRGVRLELAEIEARLRRVEGVCDAVVVADTAAGETRLVAYAVLAPGAEWNEPAVRRRLADWLPAAMQPSGYVVLDRLPTTASGKVDRRRLPAYRPRGAAEDERRAPATPLERVVETVFADLLGVSRLAADDDFFALGGHSLLAARAVGRLRRATGRSLPMRALFEHPTIEGLARRLAARGDDGTDEPPERLAPALSGELRPVAAGQEALRRYQELYPASPAYNMALAVELEGRLELAALAAALRHLEQRHEVLRWSFPDTGRARVHRPLVRLPVVDLTALGDAGACAARAGERAARRPFRLGERPPWRRALLRLADERHELLLVVHHAIADGGSLEVFWRELVAAYQAFERRRRPALAELAWRYGDFLAWLEHRSPPAASDAAATASDELLTDRPRGARRGYRGAAITGRLSDGSDLAASCARLGVTPFTACAAALAALLLRTTGGRAAAFATPLAARGEPAFESAIGYYVTTAVMRFEAVPKAPFADLLAAAREGMLNAWESRFRDLDPRSKPLTDPPALALAEQPRVGEQRTRELVWSPRLIPTESTKFELAWLLHAPVAEDGDWRLTLEYDVDLFDRTTVRRLLGQLRALLDAGLAAPERALGELEILTAARRHQLVVEWSASSAAAASAPRLLERVADHARRRPSAVALAWRRDEREHELTYGDLVDRARRLATELRARGARPGVAVGTLLGRGPQLVIGQLAVMLSGAAYVALDPTFPASRLETMLATARAPWVLVDAAGESALAGEADRPRPAPACEPVRIESLLETALGAAPVAIEAVPGERLAYVIFTSGSTGVPKGVMLRHAGLDNLVRWHCATYDLGEESRTTSLAGLGFDASVWEIWPTLAAGGRLELAPPELLLSPREVPAWLARRRIDVTFLPTPLAEICLDAWDHDVLPSLPRCVLTGGDRLRRRPTASDPTRWVNHYGPTEATVVTTAGTVGPRSGEAARAPSIGRPIDGQSVYVLDAELRPVGAAAAGELCIGGRGLARGYLFDPRTTAERFVPDPFGERGSRMYRSGDLVRWETSGALHFLGRLDRQVKIRGFRIEIGEIEAVMQLHPRVGEVVVLAVERGDETTLIGFFVSSELEPAEYSSWLRERLPAFMSPAALVPLRSIPKTASGKIDRDALPVPAPGAWRASERVAPRSALEQDLAEMWAELLESDEELGVEDDFFALGGTSLQIGELIARVREEFGVQVSAAAFFERPTIAALALRIAEALVAASEPDDLAELWQELSD